MPFLINILGIINILLFFLLSLRIYNNTRLAIITAALLAILPWYTLLVKEQSTYIIFLTIVLAVSIVFAQKIKTQFKKITTFLFITALLIFIISVVNIPKYTNVEVDAQRTNASLTKFKFLSEIFSNKLIESYRAREGLLFQNLDFGNYFFSGHPRQRVGIKEVPKFYLSMLPLLIIGAIRLKPRARWLTASILALAVIFPIPFADRTVSSGALLIIPAVFLSALGLYFLKRYRKIFLIFISIEVVFFFSRFFGGYV